MASSVQQHSRNSSSVTTPSQFRSIFWRRMKEEEEKKKKSWWLIKGGLRRSHGTLNENVSRREGILLNSRMDGWTVDGLVVMEGRKAGRSVFGTYSECQKHKSRRTDFKIPVAFCILPTVTVEQVDTFEWIRKGRRMKGRERELVEVHRKPHLIFVDLNEFRERPSRPGVFVIHPEGGWFKALF